MFGPWIEIYLWFRGLLPTHWKLRRPHFNFIVLHYMYLLSLVIIGSIIIYPSGNMAYIDALFFASGGTTQSGLNTIDVGELFVYQQVLLMIIAAIANPIFINTFVVFVRLYWFEKRFQRVVLEAQKLRRARTKDRLRSFSKGRGDPDTNVEEHNIAGRNIVVVRPGARTIEACQKVQEQRHPGDKEDQENPKNKERDTESSEESTKDGDGPKEEYEQQPVPMRERDITFADQTNGGADKKVEDDEERIPSPRSTEQHITFLERQRNQNDNTVLYIPGPRDFDRGHVPQEINAEGGLTRKKTLDGPMSPYSPGGLGRKFTFDNLPGKRRLSKSFSFDGLTKAKEKVLSFGHDADEKQGSQYPASVKSEGDTPTSLLRSGRIKTFQSMLSQRTTEKDDPTPYLSYQPTVGRNSMFVNLTEEQREELGGIEYRALKTLAFLLCTFYVGFHIFGLICFLPWILHASDATALDNWNINRSWWGCFTAASHFTDLGFTLTPNSMIPFRESIFPLLIGSFLIIIGNTGFPCMLRFCIWLVNKLVPRNSSLWEELRFLLDHPRRCFTLLFPSTATWWLFWVLVLLNGIDLIFYIILDLNDPAVTVVPAGARVLDGWYQASSTRTAGFSVVNLSDLHPGIQVSYLIMMYISVFPVAISVRRTNVYEEKSLGIWGDEPEVDEGNGPQTYVGAHLRRQLSFDLWFIFLGLFIIACIEGGRIQNSNDYAFTTFSVLFEIVSAYGTVGLSLGYPGTDTSFSAQFKTASKLVIIAMQIRGRHRGLPYALDKAILLPSEGLQRKENEDATLRMQRRASTVSRSNLPPGRDGRNNEVDELGHEIVPQHSPSISGQNVQEAHQGAHLEQRNTATTAAASSVGGDHHHHAARKRSGFSKLLSAGLSAGPTNTFNRVKKEADGAHYGTAEG